MPTWNYIICMYVCIYTLTQAGFELSIFLQLLPEWIIGRVSKLLHNKECPDNVIACCSSLAFSFSVED